MAIDAMLFEIYLHPDTGVRFGVSNMDGRWTVVESVSGRYVRKHVPTVAGIQLLAKKLKAGYVKSKGRSYFSVVKGDFCIEHPDLASGWLIAVAPPDLQQCIDKLVGAAKRAPRTVIFPEEIEAWAAEQGQHAEYVVACDDLCLWSLLIADASLFEGWPLRWSGSQPIPDEPPALAPIAWQEWLSSHFPRKRIQEAQSALGWTLERRLLTSVENPPPGENLAAFL